MSDWIAGLLALLIGAVFCFRGWIAMRIVIAMWGALAGFALGATLGSGDDGGVLDSAWSWILAIVLSLLFAAGAYLYYEVSIALAMGSIGFALGVSLLVAIGVTWSWLIVLAGLALGIVLAFVAIAGDLPLTILIVLSAMAGASAIVTGLMLLTGALDTEQIRGSVAVTEELNDDWYWYAIWIGAAIAGVIAQLRLADRMSATIRQSWQGQAPVSSPSA